MIESPSQRALALVVVGLALAGLLVSYGSLEPAPESGAYPNQEQFGPAPESYVGDRVVTIGTILDTDPVRIRVTYGADRKRTQFVVGNVDHPVERGNRLRVFGVLAAPDRIEATESFTVPAGGYVYTYVVSFLAGLWALSRIVRTWRFDREVLGLVPRSRPKPLRSLVRDYVGGGDGDA